MTSFLYTGGPNWQNEVSKLRRMGASMPNSPTQARAEAMAMRESVNNRSLIASMNRSRLGNYRGRQFTAFQGSNMQIALPKVRQPLGSLADKGIPFNVDDDDELKDIRRWSRLFYATHDLVPLLIDIYSKFPVVGLEMDSKDPLIKRFYEDMFLNELNYLEFLPDQLGREYFTVGEVTSLAHFNESLGVWSSEEILNPDMLRVSRSLFVQRDRVQLLVKEMVENLRQGPDGGGGLGSNDETPSERLQRNKEYCCTPETKVLTADLRWVPVKSLVVGDPIMGFDEYARPGKKKREWVPTRVTATKVITGNTYRIVTDGSSVECTDQHRWLSMPQNRWKALPIDTTRDEEFYPSYEWRGKQVVRTKPWVRRPCHHCGIPMELRPSAAAVTKFCSKTCSNTVKNRSYSSGKNSGRLMWLRADEVRPGDKIMFLGKWDVDDSRDAGWMGGFLDGEGSLGSCDITFSQNVGPVLDRALAILDAYKFSYSLREGKPHANTGRVCSAVRINGGWPETLRALSIFRPVRLLQALPGKIHGKEISGDWVTVTEVSHVGDQDVIALATSSQTLIAEGMFSHNTDLVRYYPEIIQAASQNDGLDISDALVSRIVNRSTPWARRGTPHLLRSFRTLMTEESLMAAQDAVADRLYSPLVLATLGIEDMGDGEPWIPDQSELDDARDDLQAALAADFRLMVHNFGLKVENVFGRESVPNLDADFERVQVKLLQAWGIGEALISGGTGGAYASSALNREFVTQIMTGFQNSLKRHIIKRAEVIAEAQGHYDYDLKGGVRVPLYREIVEVDPDTGEEHIRKVPKLLIPEIRFSTLNLRDEAQERAFISQLKAMGVPVSDKTLAVNIDMQFDQELERQAEESVAKLMATAQAMKKVQDLCDAQNLPYPPELAQHLMSTLQLRQGKTQTELAEAQAVAGEAQAGLQADQIEMQKVMLEQQMAGAGLPPGGAADPFVQGAPQPPGGMMMGPDPMPPGPEQAMEEEGFGEQIGAGPDGEPVEGPTHGPNITSPSADGPSAPGPGNPSAGYYALAFRREATGINSVNGPHGSPPAGSPPQASAGPELPPGVPEPTEIPRNRQRPVESDSMRQNTPKQVGARRKRTRRGEEQAERRLSRFETGPSSYGKSLTASEDQVEDQVRRLEVVANWDFSVARHPKVADLVMNPKFYRALHAQTYSGQLQADWPEILAAHPDAPTGKAADSHRILQDLLAQFYEIFGVEPEW